MWMVKLPKINVDVELEKLRNAKSSRIIPQVHSSKSKPKVIQVPNFSTPGPSPCSQCSDSFSSEAALKNHVRWKHYFKRPCSYCLMKSFPTEDDHDAHVAKFHCPEVPLQCKTCGKVTKDKKALWRHCRESHFETTFPCTICNIEFKRPDNLKIHQRSFHDAQTRNQRFDCRECDSTFSHMTTLRSHIRLAHRDDGVRHKCDLCSKEFRLRAVLNSHVRFVHGNEREFWCEPCGVGFKSGSHLRRHEGSIQHRNEVKTRGAGNNKKASNSNIRRRRRQIVRNSKPGEESKITEENDDDDEPFVVGEELQPGTDFKEEIPPTSSRPTRKSKSKAMQAISELEEDEVHVNEELELEKIPIVIKEDFESDVKIIPPPIAIKTESMPEEGEHHKYSDSDLPEEQAQILDIIKIEEPFLQVLQPPSDSESSSSDSDSDDFEYAKVKTEPGSGSHAQRHKTEIEDFEIIQPPSSDSEEDSSEPNYFCMYCKKGYSLLPSVQSHELKCGAYLRSKKRPLCPKCGKRCQGPHQLRLHLTTHVNDRPFSCLLCTPTPSFKRLATLKNHHDTVHKGKPTHWQKYQETDHSSPCDICGKVLTNPKNLRRHKAEIHGEDKHPYACTFCPKKFKRPGARGLSGHIRYVHQLQMKYECKLCDARFHEKKKYEEHTLRKRHLEREEQERDKRVNRPLAGHNIVLTNIPENKDADQVVAKVLQILFPKTRCYDMTAPKTERIGEVKGPRAPLKVTLPSVYYRRTALLARNKLKKVKDPELKGLELKRGTGNEFLVLNLKNGDEGDDEDVVRKLLDVLIPNNLLEGVKCQRVDFTKGCRPIRVIFASIYYKTQAMSNAHLLKENGDPAINIIEVKKDKDIRSDV